MNTISEVERGNLHTLLETMSQKLMDVEKHLPVPPTQAHLMISILEVLVDLTSATMAIVEMPMEESARGQFEDLLMEDLIRGVYARFVLLESRHGVLPKSMQLIEDCDNCPEKATCPDFKDGGYTLKDAMEKGLAIPGR